MKAHAGPIFIQQRGGRGGVVVKPLPLSSSPPPMPETMERPEDDNHNPLSLISWCVSHPTHPHPKLRNVVIVLLTQPFILFCQSGTLT